MKSIETSPIYTGTQVNYYLVCHRKLWLFSHGLDMESTSDTVLVGKLIGQESYPRQKKEVLIDNAICIDFTGSDGIIHEVKKSDKMESAHTYQLLYYLYYLKQKGLEGIKGEINYPRLKKRQEVILTEEKEREIETMLRDIGRVIARADLPPKLNERFCKKCSYYELCWVE